MFLPADLTGLQRWICVCPSLRMKWLFCFWVPVEIHQGQKKGKAKLPKGWDLLCQIKSKTNSPPGGGRACTHRQRPRRRPEISCVGSPPALKGWGQCPRPQLASCRWAGCLFSPGTGICLGETQDAPWVPALPHSLPQGLLPQQRRFQGPLLLPSQACLSLPAAFGTI